MDFASMYPVAGLLSVIVFVILLAIAVYRDRGWKLGKVTISHLATDGDDIAAICFNLGCVLSGMFSFIFGLGLLTLDNAYQWAGIPFLIASIGIIATGVIHRGYGRPHRISAGIYFLWAVVCIAMTDIACYLEGNTAVGIFGSVMLATMVLMAVTQRLPVFEPYLVLCNCTWTVIQSIMLM